MKTLFEEARRVFPELDGAEIIHIQNVADYLLSLTDDYVSVASSIPNIAPPFPIFWMEYVVPDMLYDGERLRENDTTAGVKMGFLFESQETDEGDAKWKTKITMFAKDMFARVAADFHGIDKWFCWTVDIDKNGQSTTDFNAHLVNYGEMSPEDRMKSEIEMGGHAYAWLSPALLAVAFLHCKNVNMITNEPRKATSRRASQRTSKIRFHTLQIEPMKKILHDEGRVHETGIKHALHICRGHFKDFSKGKGLFGKYQGMYWWDSQVRGRGDVGAVVKDYNVNNPQV